MKQGLFLMKITNFTPQNLKNTTMKNLTFIAVMAMALLLGACSKDEDAAVLSFKFTKEEVTSDEINLEWDAIPGAEGYDLYLTNANGSDKHEESSILKTFKFTKLLAGTEYTFTIKAYDASNNLLSEMTKKHNTVSLPTGLVGKWQNGTVTSIDEIYLLNANGTGEYTLGTNTATLHWKTSNNNIILNVNYPSGAVTETYTYETSSLGIKIGQNSYVDAK